MYSSGSKKELEDFDTTKQQSMAQIGYTVTNEARFSQLRFLNVACMGGTTRGGGFVAQGTVELHYQVAGEPIVKAWEGDHGAHDYEAAFGFVLMEQQPSRHGDPE